MFFPKGLMAKKILVADDDPVVRTLVTEFLQSRGYLVETAASGTACLQEISHEVPDVLVLDLLMPDLTGVEVLKTIRANPDTAALPIVMLSADTNTEAVVTTYQVTADCYVQKPFGVKEIVTAVEEISHKSPDRNPL